jgi:hypothetical protein
MKRGFLTAVTLSAGLLLTGCIGGNFGMPFQKTVDETRPLAASGEFELQNTNGSVRLTTWDEPRVRIEAVKHASSERALDELRVEIEARAAARRTRHPVALDGWCGPRRLRVSCRRAPASVANVNRVGVKGSQEP